VRYVDVDSRFFAREEEQPELTVADDRGCHERDVAETTERGTVREPSNGATRVKPVFRLI